MYLDDILLTFGLYILLVYAISIKIFLFNWITLLQLQQKI